MSDEIQLIPLVQSLFTSYDDGWKVITYPGDPNAHEATWVQAQDKSPSGIEYTPQSQENNYYFQAPSCFLGDRSQAVGGNLTFNISSYKKDTFPQEDIKSGATNLILKSDVLELGVDTSTCFKNDGIQCLVNVELKASAQWKNLNSTEPVTNSDIQKVLKNLTALLIKGDCFKNAVALSRLSLVKLLPDPKQALTLNLQVSYQDNQLQAQWQPISVAYAYHVEVDDKQGNQVLSTIIKAEDYQPPVVLQSSQFSPEPGATYAVSVEVLGPPSQQSVVIFSALQVLQDLKTRLENNRPDGKPQAVAFNSTTLPSNVLGKADQIWQLIQDAWSDGTPRPVQALEVEDAQLVLDQSTPSLTVSGSAQVNGKTAQISAFFTASVSEQALQLTLTETMPKEWIFSDSFPDLKYSTFDQLNLSDCQLRLTSSDHKDPAVFFDLKTGLNLQGKLTLTNSLIPVTPDTPQNLLQVRLFGGSIEWQNDLPIMNLNGATPFNELKANLIKLDPQDLNQGQLKLETSPPQGAPATEATQENIPGTPKVAVSATIVGKITIDGGDQAFVLDVPTKDGAPLNLKLQPSSLPVSTVGDATILMGSNDFNQYLPLAFTQLTQATISHLNYNFDPQKIQPTTAELTLGCTKTYSIWPNKIELTGLSLSVQISYAQLTPEQIQSSFVALLKGTFNLGDLPVDVVITIPNEGDWTITFADETKGLTLVKFTSFISVSVANVLSALPAIGGITDSVALSGAMLKFDPFKTALHQAGFTLNQTQPWNVVPNVFCIQDWVMQANIDLTTDPKSLTGLLTGSFQLGGEQGLTLDVHLPLPISDDGWSVSVQTPVQLPGLSDILNLIGAASISNILPSGIQKLGSFTVEEFEIVFNPTKSPVISSVYFLVDTTETWEIIPNKGLVMNQLESSFKLVNAANDSDKYAIGYAQGVVTVAGVDVYFVAQKQSQTAPWLFKLGAATVIHVPGLGDLVEWMFPAQLVKYIPSAFLPFPDGVDITNMDFCFDLTNAKIKEIDFSIYNSAPWKVIPDHVTLDHTYVSANITNDTEYQMTRCGIGTLLIVEGARIQFTASKSSVEADWEFSGKLINSVTIDFMAISQQIISKNIAWPQDITKYGFPAAITIDSVQASLVPAVGSFHFDGEATFKDWKFNFGITTLSIQSIAGVLDIPNKTDPATASITGKFQFAGIDTTMTLSLGQKDVDTILTAVLTPANASDVQVANVADQLAAPTTSDKWGSLVSVDMLPFKLKSADIYLNLTQQQFMFYGGLQQFANMALLCEQEEVTPQGGGTPTKVWGYLFAGGLAKDFEFKNLWELLGVIDRILSVKEAHVVVSSFTTKTIQAQTEKLKVLETIDPLFEMPVDPAKAPTKDMKKGVFFYAVIDFSVKNLFFNLVKIGNGVQPASVTISAYIDQVDSKKSVFAAGLPDITLFNAIVLTHTNDYTGIHLSYIPAKDNEFSMVGRLTLQKLFNLSYSFDGTLTMTQTKLNATLTLMSGAQNTEIIPFGLPGIVLKDLKSSLEYTFDQSDTPASHTLSVQGSVTFGSAPNELSFTCYLYLANSNPALASIDLDKTLSIIQFFTQCLTGQGALWPTDFIDLKFLQGSNIYYYDPDNDPNKLFEKHNNLPRLAGFNIHADVVLVILIDIHITMDIQVVKDQKTQKYIGVKVSGSLLQDPIDLFVLQIASTTLDNNKYTGGPTFTMDTTTPSPSMGFEAGFMFFQYAFGTAGVTIRRKDSPSEMLLSGHLASAKDFPVFGKLAVDFTYCQSKGFQIDNWPAFQFLEEAIDFVNELEKLSQEAPGGVCSKIVGFVVDNAFKTAFNISPSFSTNDDKLYFVLNGNYTMTLIGQSDPFLQLDFPKIVQFPLPNSLSLDDLPKYIFNALKEAAESFVKGLLNNADAIAKFLAIVATENAAKYAADLACQGLVEGVVADAAAAGAAAVAAAGGAIAGGAAAVAAGAAAVGAVVSACFAEGTQVVMADGTLKPIESIQVGDTLLGQDGTVNIVQEIKRPELGQRTLYALNGGAGFVTSEHPFLTTDGWKSLNPTATSKSNPELRVQQLQMGDSLILHGDTQVRLESIEGFDPGPETTLYSLTVDGNNTYFANQFLVHNKGGGGGGGGGGDVKLATPKIESLTCENNVVKASWSAVGGAYGYDYWLMAPSTQRVGGQDNINYQTRNYDLDLAGKTLEPGDYSAQVRAVRDDKKGDWGVKSIKKLATPTQLTLTYDLANDELVASWQAGSVPAGFVYVLNQDGKPQAPVDVPSSPHKLSASNLPAGKYSFSVFAKGTRVTIPGDSATSVELEKPVAPSPVNITVSESTLTVKWQKSPTAYTYDVDVTLNGVVVDSANVSDVGQKQFDCSKYEPGDCSAKVRIEGNTTLISSDWSDSSNKLTKLTTPSNLSLSGNESASEIDVTWAYADILHKFQIAVVNPSKQDEVLNTFTSDQGATSMKIASESICMEPGKYNIWIKTLADSDTEINSDYTKSTLPLTRLAPPANAKQSFSKSSEQIVGSCDLVQGVHSYTGEIVKLSDNNQVVGSQTIQTPAEQTSHDFIFKLADLKLGDGGEYQFWVKSKGSGLTLESAVAKADTSVKRLETVILDSIDYSQIKQKVDLTWKPVPDATGYAAKISYDNKTELTQNSTETSITLETNDLSRGTNYVSVKAIGSDDVLDGAWSEEQQFIVPILTPELYAKQCAYKGYSAEATGSKLKRLWPDISDTRFALDLQEADYKVSGTAQAIKNEFGYDAKQTARVLASTKYTPWEIITACSDLYSGSSKNWTYMNTLSGELGWSTSANITTYIGKMGTQVQDLLKQTNYELVQYQQEIFNQVTQPVGNQFKLDASLYAVFSWSTSYKLIGIKQDVAGYSFNEYFKLKQYDYTRDAFEVFQEVYNTTTPEELAIQSKNQGLNAAQTGEKLKTTFPSISADTFASAMKGADYDVNGTTQAIKENFPNNTVQATVQALKAAEFNQWSLINACSDQYSGSTQNWDYMNKLAGETGCYTSDDITIYIDHMGSNVQELLYEISYPFNKYYVQILINVTNPVVKHFDLDGCYYAMFSLATSYKVVGIDQAVTSINLDNSVKCELDSRVVVAEVYKSPTPEKLASNSKNQGLTAAQTGEKLKSTFPIIPVNSFAKAMQRAGYSLDETAPVLKTQFAQTNAQDAATALKMAKYERYAVVTSVGNLYGTSPSNPYPFMETLSQTISWYLPKNFVEFVNGMGSDVQNLLKEKNVVLTTYQQKILEQVVTPLGDHFSVNTTQYAVYCLSACMKLVGIEQNVAGYCLINYFKVKNVNLPRESFEVMVFVYNNPIVQTS